jgi:hypothetical protein
MNSENHDRQESRQHNRRLAKKRVQYVLRTDIMYRLDIEKHTAR